MLNTEAAIGIEGTKAVRQGSYESRAGSVGMQRRHASAVAVELADRLEAAAAAADTRSMQPVCFRLLPSAHQAAPESKALVAVQVAVHTDTAGREEHCSCEPEQRGASRRQCRASRRSCCPS